MVSEIAALRLSLFSTGIGRKSVDQHERNLRRLLKDCQPFTEDTVRAFLANHFQQGFTAASANKYIQTVKKYCHLKGLKWGENVKKVREDARIKVLMSDTEIDQFIHLNMRLSRNKRQYEVEKYSMFWAVAAFTGARPTELCNLTVNDIDTANNVFIIGKSKTKTGRLVPIAPNIREQLADYIKTLQSHYIFPLKYKYDKPINLDALRKDFRERKQYLGITKNVTPYSLRHSYITRMLTDAEAPLFVVQDIVGHTKADTTRQYYHSNLKAMHKAVQNDPMIRKYIQPEKLVATVIEYLRGIFSNDDRFDPVEIQEAFKHLYKAIKK